MTEKPQCDGHNEYSTRTSTYRTDAAASVVNVGLSRRVLMTFSRSFLCQILAKRKVTDDFRETRNACEKRTN
jgi:hypothetical protein